MSEALRTTAAAAAAVTKTIDSLPDSVQTALMDLLSAIQRDIAGNLASLIVYGSSVRGGFREGVSDIDLIIVLKDTSPPNLAALSNALLLARFGERIETMILRLDEIASASDVFPLFYDDVQRQHVVVFGVDPFKGLRISDEHIRVRIEQELREARIRMRRAAVDASGSDDAVARALARKVKQIRGPLHSLLRLKGVACSDSLEPVLTAIGTAYGFDTGPLLSVAENPKAAHAAFRVLVERTIDDVDSLQVRPS